MIAAHWDKVEDQTGIYKIIFTQSFQEFYKEQPLIPKNMVIQVDRKIEIETEGLPCWRGL